MSAPKEENRAGGFDLGHYYANKDVEVWPENWRVVSLFVKLGTQWQIGMNGPIGLRYEAVYGLLDRMTESKQEWEEMFDDICYLERESLSVMRG